MHAGTFLLEEHGQVAVVVEVLVGAVVELEVWLLFAVSKNRQ